MIWRRLFRKRAAPEAPPASAGRLAAVPRDDAGLPDYLLEGEDEPTVPLDAMPVPPTGGGS